MHALLLAEARKRAATMTRLPAATQQRRLAAWLQRRGHSWGAVSRVLSELDLGLGGSW